MKTASLFTVLVRLLPLLLAAAGLARAAEGTAQPTLTINAGEVKGHSSPLLYGIMTEEINYSYDGGLYAELIANRTFQDPANNPKRWSVLQDPGAAGTMEFDSAEKLNDRLPVSLKLTATAASATMRVGVANEGFWGIPVRPGQRYTASFYAKAAPGFSGPLTVAISSKTGPDNFATATIPALTSEWKKYEVTLTAGGSVGGAALQPTKNAEFRIWTNAPGTVWFSLVSLFPPTYANRPNGLRPDIMQLLADYHPAFLRFPGGNYLEGRDLANRFDWKKTVGDVAERAGHMSPWNYRSSDGLGLLEFLEWCEDLKMQPLLAVFSGLVLGGGANAEVKPGDALQPYVQDALDEIEYVTGAVSTKWGAVRAQDGHPAPFQLTYVEVGNEDWRGDYNGRFTQLHDAIKAKYPDLQLIDASVHSPNNGRLTSTVKDRKPDVQDSHIYMTSEQQAESSATAYDKYDRTGPKVFEGEWATRVPNNAATPNFAGAMGDAAYMTGLERNSDAVIMASYAPLFVNVSNALGGRNAPGSSMQWPVNLIGYDALTSYGSPAFYAQVMFNNNRGDEILAISATDVGTRSWQAPAGGGNRRGAAAAGGGGAAGAAPGGAATAGATPAAPAVAAAPAAAPAAPARQLPTLFYVATRDSKTGVIYLKVVNPLDTPQDVRVAITGATAVMPDGESVIMKADKLDDTNSVTEPKKIVPVTARETGFGPNFTRTVAPYSINIYKISTR